MNDSLPNGEKPLYRAYNHPQPRLRRALARLTGLLLALLIVIAFLQVLLAVILGGVLSCAMPFFVGLLALPLLFQSVFHPEITLSAEGLSLRPLLWRAQFIPWTALRGIAPHPLLRNNAILGQFLHGKAYRPRQGAVVLVDRSAGLSLLYWMLAWLVGAGTCAAFAISSTTHADYEMLRAAIAAHCPPISA